MRPNGASHNGQPLGSQQNQSRLVFNRVDRYIGRVSKTLAAENVHRFRTNSRRVEALIAELVPETRNKKKLLRLLSKLRKKAGKLRDIDVQTTFLKALKVPDRQNHRAQLLEILAEEHSRRSRKLSKAFDPETVRELRKRLRRAQAEIKLDGFEPLRCAYACLPKPGQAQPNEKFLHACRIAAKQARYLAELDADSAAATAFVAELKRAQDAIGEWHDVLKLQGQAEQRFGSARESALVAALQNISRARFRRAESALVAALNAVSRLQHSGQEKTGPNTDLSAIPVRSALVA
jgi:CHAD domain-containing protein